MSMISNTTPSITTGTEAILPRFLRFLDLTVRPLLTGDRTYDGFGLRTGQWTGLGTGQWTGLGTGQWTGLGTAQGTAQGNGLGTAPGFCGPGSSL